MKKPSISIPRGFRSILSRKTVLSLPPGLSYRAITLLSSAYPEKTISSSTKLSILYELWLSQRKSGGRLLAQSEKMIMEMGRLHYFEVQQGLGKPAGTKISRRKAPLRGHPPLMAASSQLYEKLAKLGITDRNTIHRLEKSIGRDELELRVEGALDAFKGREPVGRQIFSRKPDILIKRDDDFFDALDGFAIRIRTIDRLREAVRQKGARLPASFDYLSMPGLIMDDSFLYRLWAMQVPESAKRG